VMFVTAHLLQERDIKPTLYLLYSVGILIGILNLYQSFVWDIPSQGLAVNKNNNAALLNLFILPLLSLLLFWCHEGVFKWLGKLVFTLLFLALLQTISRGAILSFFIVALPMIGLALYRRKTTEVVHVLGLIAVAFTLDAILSPLEFKTDMHSSSRWLLFSTTIDMIRNSHWYGAGSGMFFYTYPPLQPLGDHSAGYLVHNDYLQFLYEQGIPGFAIFSFFGVLLCYRGYYLVKDGKGMLAPLYPGLLAGIAAVAIHSLVTFNFYVLYILIVMGFYAGLIVRYAPSSTLVPAFTYTLKIDWKIWTLLGVLALASIKSIVLPGYADAVSKGVLDTVYNDGHPEYWYEVYTDLRALAPDNPQYPWLAAMALADSGRGKSAVQREAILHKCRQLLRESRNLNSFASEVYSTEALILYEYKDVAVDTWYKEAKSLAKKALEKRPRDTRTRKLLAQIMVAGEEKRAALKVLADGLNLPNNTDMQYYRYGWELAKRLGDSETEARFRYLIDHFPPGLPR
jgi:O-antigen ligase